jgi:hypothetical protein
VLSGEPAAKIYLTPQRKIKLCESPHEVELFVLGPLDKTSMDYRSKVSNIYKFFRYTNPEKTEIEIDEDWDPTAANHNYASSIFLIKFGDTKILLPGDAEIPSWNEILADQYCSPSLIGCLKTNILKVAHHGSKNGYVNGLYTHCFSGSTGVAVLTGYNRGEKDKRLPTKEGVEALPISVNVLTTCRSLAEETTGLAWEEPLSDYLPPSSIASLKYNLKDELPNVIKEIPKNNFSGLIEDNFRISLYFNNKGKEIRRQMGIETGILKRT